MLRPGLFALILMVLGLAGLAAGVSDRWERFSRHWYKSASLPQPGRSEPDEIRRAVYAEGQVWALAEREVWRIDPAAGRASRTGAVAHDICVHEGELTIVTASASKPGRWAIEKRRVGEWVGVAEVEDGGDGLVGLDCGSELRVLSTSRLIMVGSGAEGVVKLSHRIPAWPARSVLGSTSERLLVGVDAGEWGGALMRIDRRTGRVEELEHDGPEQINAIAPHPSRPDCDLVSAGNSQSWSGALLEVCGERVGVITSRECVDWPCDAAFYSMADLGSGVLVTTVGGLYRVVGDGELSAVGKPRFSQAGPFQVSVGPNYVLVRAPVDERFHPGGSNAFAIDVPPAGDGA